MQSTGYLLQVVCLVTLLAYQAAAQGLAEKARVGPMVGPIVGGLFDMSAKDPEVVKAALYCVQELNGQAKTQPKAGGSYSLREVTSAQGQIVAGIKYYVEILVEAGHAPTLLKCQVIDYTGIKPPPAGYEIVDLHLVGSVPAVPVVTKLNASSSEVKKVAAFCITQLHNKDTFSKVFGNSMVGKLKMDLKLKAVSQAQVTKARLYSMVLDVKLGTTTHKLLATVQGQPGNKKQPLVLKSLKLQH